MTAEDRAEQVVNAYAYHRRQGLRGDDLRQKLQDLVEMAIRNGVIDAMRHRGKTDGRIKADADLFRWINASPAHQAAVRFEMEQQQNLGLRAAAIMARAKHGRKGLAA